MVSDLLSRPAMFRRDTGPWTAALPDFSPAANLVPRFAVPETAGRLYDCRTIRTVCRKTRTRFTGDLRDALVTYRLEATCGRAVFEVGSGDDEFGSTIR